MPIDFLTEADDASVPDDAVFFGADATDSYSMSKFPVPNISVAIMRQALASLAEYSGESAGIYVPLINSDNELIGRILYDDIGLAELTGGDGGEGGEGGETVTTYSVREQFVSGASAQSPPPGPQSGEVVSYNNTYQVGRKAGGGIIHTGTPGSDPDYNNALIAWLNTSYPQKIVVTIADLNKGVFQRVNFCGTTNNLFVGSGAGAGYQVELERYSLSADYSVILRRYNGGSSASTTLATLGTISASVTAVTIDIDATDATEIVVTVSPNSGNPLSTTIADSTYRDGHMGIAFSRSVGGTPVITFDAGASESEESGGGVTTENPLLARTARILTIGDSFTVGEEANPTGYRSYRGQLDQLLIAGGFDVDFIGTQSLDPDVGDDPHHDGYNGAYIGPGGDSNNISDKLTTIFAGVVEPDIIILCVGWNSVYNEPTLAGGKFRDLVNQIRNAKPTAHIVVTTLTPQRSETEAQTNVSQTAYQALNTEARALANQSETDQTYLADLATAALVYADYWNVNHWVQAGADKVAQIIYDALIAGPLAGEAPEVETPTGAANAVQEIIDDMFNDNDGTFDGVTNPGFRWRFNPNPAQLAMGASSRGIDGPTWFKNSGSVEAQFKDADYWNGFTHWFVAFEEPENAASNVRSETRKCKAYYLSKSTGQWTLLGQTDGAGWYRVTKSNLQWVGNISTAGDLQTLSDGSVSLRLRGSQPEIYHGEWLNYRIPIHSIASDIQAIFVTMQSRLVLHDAGGTNDLAAAKWLIQSGADYYPETSTQVGSGAGQLSLVPGVGLSRGKRLTENWQNFNFCTLNIPRAEGTSSPTNQYITTTQLQNNPPPLAA